MVKKNDRFSFSDFLQTHYPDFSSEDVLALYREAIMNGYSLDEVNKVVETKLGDLYSLVDQDENIFFSRSRRWSYHLLAILLLFVGVLSLVLAVRPIYEYVLGSSFLAHKSVIQPVPMEEVIDSNPIAVEDNNSDQSISNYDARNNTTSHDNNSPIIIDNLTYLKLDNWFDQQYVQEVDEDLKNQSPQGHVAGDFDTKVANMPAAVDNAYYLDIPKLKIKDAKVKIGANDLDKSLIQYSGTARPGEYGSPVIFGHSVLRTFYNPKKTNKRRYVSIFSTIMTLERGDKIFIKVGDVKYTYMVTAKTEVQPTDTYILKQKKDYKKLKLVTCVPEGTYLRRGVVSAQLIEN